MSNVECKVLAKTEEQGHQKVPLLLALAFWDGVDFTTVVFPHMGRGHEMKSSDEKQGLLPINHIPFMDFREMRSNAPTPSTETTVVLGSKSENLEDVGHCLAPSFRLQYVPMGSRGHFHLLGVLLRTRPNHHSPTTMPRSPPSGFRNAVNRPRRRAFMTSSGNLAVPTTMRRGPMQ